MDLHGLYRRRIELKIMGMINNPDFISINNISIVPYYVAENIGIGIMPLSLVPRPCLPLYTNAKKTPLGCPFHANGGEGSRTPVRRQRHIGVYGCSCSFDVT